MKEVNREARRIPSPIYGVTPGSLLQRSSQERKVDFNGHVSAQRNLSEPSRHRRKESKRGKRRQDRLLETQWTDAVRRTTSPSTAPPRPFTPPTRLSPKSPRFSSEPPLHDSTLLPARALLLSCCYGSRIHCPFFFPQTNPYLKPEVKVS